MAWVFPILLGLFIAPLLYWLAIWAPSRIEREESEWIRELTGIQRDLQLAPPSPLWSANFWRQSRQSPLFWIAVIGAPIVAVTFGHKFTNAASVPMSIFGLTMLGMALADQHSQYLPDSMTLGLLWAGLVWNLLPGCGLVSLELAVIGAATGYLVLWTAAKIFLLMRKQDGLGHGDMKLMAAAGAWLGPFTLAPAILAGCLFAIVFQGAKILLKKSGPSDMFAFGPWLATGVIFSALLV